MSLTSNEVKIISRKRLMYLKMVSRVRVLKKNNVMRMQDNSRI